MKVEIANTTQWERAKRERNDAILRLWRDTMAATPMPLHRFCCNSYHIFGFYSPEGIKKVITASEEYKAQRRAKKGLKAPL